MHDLSNLATKTVYSFVDELEFIALTAIPLSIPRLRVPKLDVEILGLGPLWDEVRLYTGVSCWPKDVQEPRNVRGPRLRHCMQPHHPSRNNSSCRWGSASLLPRVYPRRRR